MRAKEQNGSYLIRPKNWREIGCAYAVIFDGKKGYIPADMCTNCQRPVGILFKWSANYCPNCGEKIVGRIGDL